MLLFLVLLACTKSDDEFDNSDAIELSVYYLDSNAEVTEIVGDGTSIIKLRAIIPKETKNDYRTVTFKCSNGGQFQGTTANPQEIQIDANQDGIAQVNVKIPFGNDPFTVSAEVNADRKYVDAKTIIMELPENVIELDVLDENNDPLGNELVGDGSKIIKLRSRVNYNRETFDRVKFTCSNGGKILASNNDVEKTVNINQQGFAEVDVKIPFGEEPFIVSATIDADDSYTITKIINLFIPDNVIDFEVLDIEGNLINNPIRADNYTTVQLKAKVNYNVDSFNVVSFTKNAGVFSNGTMVNDNNFTKNISQDSTAIIYLTVPKNVVPLYLQAKVGTNGNYYSEENINLIRAYPDQIVIEPESIDLVENTTYWVNVSLLREFGEVSNGTEVSFLAYQEIEGSIVEVGRFTGLANAVSNNGTISGVNFITDTGDFVLGQSVFIKVTSQNDEGQLVENIVQLNI